MSRSDLPSRAVLVCAFEPFGGRRTNRALLAARALGDVVVLPVSFARLPSAVRRLFRHRPSAILLCGEHRRARAMHVERVARNRIAAGIADNDFAKPRRPVVRGGPMLRLATWPARAIAAAIRAAGARAELSNDAGDFACNAALYLALAERARRGHPIAVGFLHVPADRRRMPIAEIRRGLAAAVAVLEARSSTTSSAARRAGGRRSRR
ncbi:MAG: pyroglutamyl-peptidase I [Myxococcota bacterium]